MTITCVMLRCKVSKAKGAFTLLEVMIASAIFFMAVFAILALVSSNLRNARLLQEQTVNAGILIADYCQTNKLEEGPDHGDFGQLYPGYKWDSDTVLVSSNGLFKVDYLVTHPGGHGERTSVNSLSALLFRPDSPTSPGFR